MAAGFLTIFKQDKKWRVILISPGQYHIINDFSIRDDAESHARAVASEHKLAYVGPDERLVTVYPIANCYVVAYQNMTGHCSDEKDKLDLGQVIGAGTAQEDFWTVYEEAERLAKKEQLAFVPLLFSPLHSLSGQVIDLQRTVKSFLV